MLGSWPRWVILLIIGVILIAWSVYWAWGQMQELPIGYESKGEKARFLRYLSCSYAMCAQSCNSPEVIALSLDMESGMTVLGCYDKCSEMASDAGVPTSEHLCGSGYKLEFEFQKKVIYFSDYPVQGSLPWITSMETDIMRYRNWHGKIQGDDWCFDATGEDIYLDGFEVDSGCQYGWWGASGTCEGILRSGGGCVKGQTLKSGEEDSQVGTGHIWIDPAITNLCELFNVQGTTENYYGNCTFPEAQKIYIWTGLDYYDYPFPLSGRVYCPELIICSSPP